METLKRIGLIVHGGRADAPAYARRAVGALQGAGAQVWAERDAAAKLSLPALEEIQSVDALVSLGGDGTLLRAVQQAVRRQAPPTGINLGRVGFLTETEPERLEEAAQALVAGRYTLEERWPAACPAGTHGRGLSGTERCGGQPGRLCAADQPGRLVRAGTGGALCGRRTGGSHAHGFHGVFTLCGRPDHSSVSGSVWSLPLFVPSRLQHRPVVVPGGRNGFA